VCVCVCVCVCVGACGGGGGVRGLALGGVWEDEVAAEHLSVQRGEGVRGLGVHQPEELQLVDVEVADGLHDREFGHHLQRQGRRRGEFEHVSSCYHSFKMLSNIFLSGSNPV